MKGESRISKTRQANFRRRSPPCRKPCGRAIPLPDGGAVKDANDVHRALGLSVLAERLSEVETPPEPSPDEKPLPPASDAELDMLFPEPDLDAMPAYMAEDVPVAVADGPGQKPDPEPEPLREDAPGQAPGLTVRYL